MIKLGKLSASNLFEIVRSGFGQVEDHRKGKNGVISLTDALMSAFVMFNLKDPSLLEFDERREEENAFRNIKQIYQIENIPSDTHMRDLLDPVNPEELRPIFKELFRQAQRGNLLRRMRFMGGRYLLSLDGTGYFSSKKIRCDHCLQRNHKNGKVTYYHQVLTAVLIHPNVKEVIPLTPEPIIKQDGETKNDCERNAAKRLLAKFREDHPRLPVIVVEDGLSSNAPHIRELRKHNCSFILVVKEGDHPFLFRNVRQARTNGETTEIKFTKKGVVHQFSFLNQTPLNESNQDILVNFLQYWQIHPDGKVSHWAWIVDFTLSKRNVKKTRDAGRARWKSENETHNTLKNQEYSMEHNYGHGKKNLSVVFLFIMMLSFAIDQIQSLACPLYKAARKKKRTRKSFWGKVRSLFQVLSFASLEEIYEAIYYGYEILSFKILYDTS